MNTKYEFIVQKDTVGDIKQKIKNLPYKFIDHHSLDKKIDPKVFLDLNLFPIHLKKLIELINIKLIKLKFNLKKDVPDAMQHL